MPRNSPQQPLEQRGAGGVMQAAPATLELVADTDGLLADIELLTDAANRFPEVRNRLLGLGQPSLETFSSDLEATPTAGAFECRVGFQLPDAFRELARAVRAGDFGKL